MPNTFSFAGKQVPVTTITEALDTDDVSFTLGSATDAPTAPFLATIDPGESTQEVILVAARSSTSCSGVVRNYNGTGAQSHSAGAFIVLGDYDEAALVPQAPEAAYTQTYSTANKTVAAATSETLTDNTTGTASNTLAAGVGVNTVSIPITLAAITGAGDVLTNYTPGYKFKLLAASFAVAVPATTASKAATLNLEIGTTNVTGGEVALTSANCTPLGALVAGAAITAANTGTSTDTISVEAASVTAFAEGSGYLLLKIQNMDTADAFASLVDEQVKLKADDLDNRQSITAIIDDLQAKGIAG